MKQSNSNSPWPEDSPLGTIESRAAARALAEAKRNGVLTHESECEGMEQDINVNIVTIGGDASRRAGEKEVREPAVFDEKKPEAADAEVETKPRCAQDEAAEDEAVREARFADYMASRRRSRRRWRPGMTFR